MLQTCKDNIQLKYNWLNYLDFLFIMIFMKYTLLIMNIRFILMQTDIMNNFHYWAKSHCLFRDEPGNSYK